MQYACTYILIKF